MTDQKSFSGTFQADLSFPKPGGDQGEKMDARVLISYDDPKLKSVDGDFQTIQKPVVLLVSEIKQTDGEGNAAETIEPIIALVTGQHNGSQNFYAQARYEDKLVDGTDFSIGNIQLDFMYADGQFETAAQEASNTLLGNKAKSEDPKEEDKAGSEIGGSDLSQLSGSPTESASTETPPVVQTGEGSEVQGSAPSETDPSTGT
ncbi:hypothetical protein IQ254_27815 [Nodosilinea sp. LEGE 07088]|uniref:hypothetical protein n=1 Tax=Nodosilinea sp. LEGE 07088 TaxID=2777968 RepID=UPI0018817F85|nr:hypothetical protein [Nodosilinea sp. LEGE 07088]MBE9140962.1 hypothetical protein [Nodosilinea sp. LEGE 07088]